MIKVPDGSKHAWQPTCLGFFPFFSTELPSPHFRQLRVVYVMKRLQEALKSQPEPEKRPRRWWSCLWAPKEEAFSYSTPDPRLSRAAHLLSMKVETAKLAKQRRLHGAISIGAAGPQQGAFALLGEVTDSSPALKMIVMPPRPSVHQLPMRLRFDTLVLSVYTIVRHPFLVDMSGNGDPIHNLATGLRMPRLARTSFPRFPWCSKQPIPNEKILSFELAEFRLDASDAVLVAGPLV